LRDHPVVRKCGRILPSHYRVHPSHQYLMIIFAGLILHVDRVVLFGPLIVVVFLRFYDGCNLFELFGPFPALFVPPQSVDMV